MRQLGGATGTLLETITASALGCDRSARRAAKRPCARFEPKLDHFTAAQPASFEHSTELSVEQAAMVPAHADQVQLAAVHDLALLLPAHGLGVPEQALAAHLQPDPLMQVSVVTRLAHVLGCPVHGESQVQPEASHVVELPRSTHAVAFPTHFVVNEQPSIFRHSSAVCPAQALGVPMQLLVGSQPLPPAHC